MIKKTILPLIGLVIISVVGYYAYQIIDARRDESRVRIEFLNPDHNQLEIGELSNRQRDILISVQDPNFWNHNGVEFRTPGSGWTTITQSLAKWFYFDPFKPGFRKIEQTLLALFVINKQFTKEEQLTIFINHVWFDREVKGFRNAAYHFYQKDIGDLTEDEYLSLVAMPVDPKKYNVSSNKRINQRRVNRIKAMLNGEYVPKGLLDIYYDKP